MRIGIFLNAHRVSGGAYHYAVSLIKALHTYHDEFVLFTRSKDLIPEEWHPQWEVIWVPPDIFAREDEIKIHRSSNDIDIHFPGFNLKGKDFFLIHRIELLLLTQPSTPFEWGIPYIMPIHDLQHRLQPEFPEVSAGGTWQQREYTYRNAARYAQGILVDSDTGKEDVLTFYHEYISPERIYPLPFLPAYVQEKSQEANIREKYQLPSRYLFYPAQFWLHKNHARLIHAVSLLRTTHHLDTPLVLVGSNNSWGATHEARELIFQNAMVLAEQLNVKDLVHYLGYVPDEDMPSLYKEAVALVMPTFFGPTNIPISEAWGLNCPVITSDVRGVREHVGEAGILADPKNTQALAQAILTLWTDETLRQSLIKKGQEQFVSYQFDVFSKKLHFILDDVKKRLTSSNCFDKHHQTFTLFATPKPFLNPHITIIQRNAIKSWTLLQPRPEIILFGNEPGIAEIAQEFGLRHVLQVKCNEYGTPLADDLFAQAQSLARHDLLVYINADIILTSHFMTAVQQVKTHFDQFLMLGQRWDAQITAPLDFGNPQWEQELLQSLPRLGTIHPPIGSDYFVFTKSLWPHVPPFAIGRAAWDIGMVYQALSHQFPVVDTSQVNLVIHQNHNYAHVSGGQEEVWKGIEAQRNYVLAGEAFSYQIGGEGKGYIAHASWELTPSGMKQRNEQPVVSPVSEKLSRENVAQMMPKSTTHPLKIIIGSSGTVPPPGWIATEQHTLDLLNPTHWAQHFSPASLTTILAEHVWEHLTWEEGLLAAKNCYTYLAQDGYIRTAVPDGYHPHSQYIDWVKPHGNGPGADDHKILYTYQNFKELFERAGFQVELLEYFDEQGHFHFKEWDMLGGMIYRSKRFDERNQDGTLHYTSIILDAKKKI